MSVLFFVSGESRIDCFNVYVFWVRLPYTAEMKSGVNRWKKPFKNNSKKNKISMQTTNERIKSQKFSVWYILCNFTIFVCSPLGSSNVNIRLWLSPHKLSHFNSKLCSFRLLFVVAYTHSACSVYILPYNVPPAPFVKIAFECVWRERFLWF